MSHDTVVHRIAGKLPAGTVTPALAFWKILRARGSCASAEG